MNKERATGKHTAPELQVMICTYGKEGIEKVASSLHPRVHGVEYLVSWQTDSECPAPKELDRDDFRIAASFTKGLSVNRNTAISLATAPLLLISDDDIDYTEEQLLSVINSFKTHPDADILTFQYDSVLAPKSYPSVESPLSKPPKGYFVTSIEIAFRRDAVKGKIWFNENFGIGAIFPSGEEDVFLKDCLDSGLRGLFIPITIARHDGTTTSERNMMLPSRPQTKGAVFLRIHPRSWFPRMIVHALREIPLWRKGIVPSPLSYCADWLRGARKARKEKVFPTPDYSRFYPCND